MEDEFELVTSPLGRKITQDGVTVEICIYRGADEQGWLLEVVDHQGGSTIWDDRFPTDQLALDEALHTIENEGIASFADSTSASETASEKVPPQTRSLAEVLTRLDAKLAVWQVGALFLGAQASTQHQLGPQSLLHHIFGASPVLGTSLEDANANIQPLVTAWNDIVRAHESGSVKLSDMPLDDPPQLIQLQALTQRRASEITWFTRGIDAGGDDPIEFGEDGEALLHKLGEAGAYLTLYQDTLRKDPAVSAEARRESGRVLQGLTTTIESIIDDLMTVSDAVRRQAVAEHTLRAGRRTDDGVRARPQVKVGRNALCPCGSGRKWKRCCGAPSAVH